MGLTTPGWAARSARGHPAACHRPSLVSHIPADIFPMWGNPVSCNCTDTSRYNFLNAERGPDTVGGLYVRDFIWFL